ncbi:MAG: hypothetical protein GC201_11255 [Alphaproteobacteria bacterium]|nr:hypothetical protein [Alphaproteobacteria bacterium]
MVGAASQEAPLKRVEPGKPDDSYLIHKLEGTQKDVGGKGARMPFSGPPLDKDQMALLRQWIEEGAPDN